MQLAIRCMLIRGGTSKGAFFLASDLPAEVQVRNKVLRAALGSPEPRQVDGIGGADPLASKVAIVGRSRRPEADVDDLFAPVELAVRPRITARSPRIGMLRRRGSAPRRSGHLEKRERLDHALDDSPSQWDQDKNPGGRDHQLR